MQFNLIGLQESAAKTTITLEHKPPSSMKVALSCWPQVEQEQVGLCIDFGCTEAMLHISWLRSHCEDMHQIKQQVAAMQEMCSGYSFCAPPSITLAEYQQMHTLAFYLTTGGTAKQQLFEPNFLAKRLCQRLIGKLGSDNGEETHNCGAAEKRLCYHADIKPTR